MAVRTAVAPKPLTKSFDELAAHLRMAEGAVVLLVTTSDRELEESLADVLRDRLGEPFTILEFIFSPQQLSLPHYLRTLSLPPGRYVLFVRGLDALSPKERRMALQAMNIGRERLRLAGLPLVFWLRPSTVDEWLVHAPDVWVVRSAAFTFELPPDETVREEALAILRLGAAKGLDELRHRYLDWLVAAHRWVDFRGLLQVRNLLRVPLEDIFVEPQLVRPPTADRRPQFELPDQPDVIPSVDRLRLMTPVEERVTLAEALREHRYLVVLGDPGSGKSTLLRHLALAAARGGPHPNPPPITGEGRGGGRFPILLPITAYAAARAKERGLTLADYLPRYWIQRGLPDFGPLFTRELRRGRALLLLDGMDEVQHPEARATVAREVRNLAIQYPANRFIVTSRIAGYHGAPLGGDFVEVTIALFGPEEIEQFARRWSRAYEAAGGWTPESEERAEMRAHDLAEAVNSHPGIQRLATNPLLLTILALIHYQGTRLPHRRVELYRLSVQALAETWNLARSLTGRPIDLWLDREPLDERRVVRTLAPIAFWMHEQVPGGLVERAVLQKRIAQHFVEHEGRTPEQAVELATDFLDLIREQSGLLMERGLDLYSFMHLTFQEYLAARHVAAQEEPFALLQPHLHDPRWREVVLLTAGILGDFSEAHASRFVRQILEARSPYNDLLQWDLLLAARCLADDVPVQPDLRDRILDALFELWCTPSYEKLFEETDDVLATMGGTRYGGIVSQWLLGALRDEAVTVRRWATGMLGELGRADETVVQALLAALRDEDELVRAGGAWGLGGLGRADDLVVQNLLTAVQDQAEVVRVSAVGSLVALGRADEGVVQALLAALRDKAEGVRARVAMVLGGLGRADDAVVEAFLAALQDEAEDVRAAAAWGLGRLGRADEAVVKDLLASLRDEAEGVRAETAEALAALGHGDDVVVQTLLGALQDKIAAVRGRAAWALGRLGRTDETVVRALVATLGDEEEAVRALAANALGVMACTDSMVVNALLAALRDDEVEGVRVWAAFALGALDYANESVVQALLAALHDEAERVRAAAAWALGELGFADDTVVDALLSTVRDRSPEVRGRAASALGRIGYANDAVLGALLKTLRDRAEWARMWAAEALGELGCTDYKVVKALADALRDRSMEVRGKAAWALGHLGRPTRLGVRALKMAARDQRYREPVFAGERSAPVYDHAFEALWALAEKRYTGGNR